MDQELLERERAFRNDPSPETELRLAQAYLRGGQGDAAWDHYVACGLQDPGLDDLGHDLAAAEAPALAELPEWVNAQAAGGRGPVTFISVAPPEDEAFPPLGTFRFLHRALLHVDGEVDLRPALEELLRLRVIELNGSRPTGIGEFGVLAPSVLSGITAVPNLTDLSLVNLLAPDHLGPLGALGSTLERLHLRNLARLSRTTWGWLSRLRTLRTLELEQVDVDVHGLAQVPSALRELRLRSLDLGEAPLSQVLSRHPLESLVLDRVGAAVEPNWLGALPKTLRSLELGSRFELGGRFEIAEFVQELLRLPKLERLALRPSRGDDLGPLRELPALRSLELSGGIRPATLRSLAPLLGRLDALKIADPLDSEGFDFLLEHLRGGSLRVWVVGATSAQLARLESLKLETVDLRAQPLTRDAAARLEERLRESIPYATVRRAGWGLTGPRVLQSDVVDLLRQALGLPNLGVSTRWVHLQHSDRAVIALRDAYGVELRAPEDVGDAVQQTLAHVAGT